MTTPVPPITEPDPSTMICPGSHVGLCAGCQQQTWRYGPGGLPRCSWCFADQKAKWGPGVRFTSTRG